MLVIGELTLERLERSLGLAAGRFDQADPFEQLRAGGLGIGEFGLELLELSLSSGACVLMISELCLQARQGSFGQGAAGFGGVELLEQLGCGRLRGGESVAESDLFVALPVELLLGCEAALLGTDELPMQFLKRGLRLAAGGFGCAEALNQLRGGILSVGEFRLEVLVGLLQLLELSLSVGTCLLVTSELFLQVPEGSFGGLESLEQLGCGCPGSRDSVCNRVCWSCSRSNRSCASTRACSRSVSWPCDVSSASSASVRAASAALSRSSSSGAAAWASASCAWSFWCSPCRSLSWCSSMVRARS